MKSRNTRLLFNRFVLRAELIKKKRKRERENEEERGERGNGKSEEEEKEKEVGSKEKDF